MMRTRGPAIYSLLFHWQCFGGACLLVATLAVAIPRTALAYDTCNVHTGQNFTGTIAAFVLNDDTTFANYNSYGTTSARSYKTLGTFGGGDATNQMQSIWMGAGLTDIHAYMYVPETYHPDAIAGTQNDVGGNGYDFHGGVWAFRCPKGYTCGWNATGAQLQNRAFICQREYWMFNHNISGTYAPLASNNWMTNACDYNWDPGYTCPASWNGTGDGCDCGCANFTDSDCRRDGIADELNTLISSQVLADSGRTLSNRHSYARWEPLRAMCVQRGLYGTATDGCNDGNRMAYTDLLRVHWDGRLGVAGVAQTCTKSVTVWDILSLGFTYAVKTFVCNLTSGDYRVAFDMWLQPYEAVNNFYAFGFSQIDSGLVNVHAYSGSFAQTVANEFASAVGDTNPAAMMRTQFNMKLGDAWCTTPSSRLGISDVTGGTNGTRDCTTYKGNCLNASGVYDSNLAGINLFHCKTPDRIQFGLEAYLNATADGNSFQYFHATGLSDAGSAGYLDFEMHLPFGR